MTTIGSVVETAKARVAAVEAQAAVYIPQILDAHNKVVVAERSGHRQSLGLAIEAGTILLAAKKAVKGEFKWTDWCAEHLSAVPQTTRSLYMRLAENKDKLLKPDLGTEDGKKISNAVATLTAKGELSIRKAAALLTTRTRQSSTPKTKRTNEDIGREWLRTLAVDELATILRDDHRNDPEYLTGLAAALRPVGEASVRRM